MTPQIHTAILHEIVRLIDSRSRVPERVRVRGRQYQLTYLEDHKRRLEEAIRRRDSERRNMLYGQLASKVKYQLIRQSRSAAKAATRSKGSAKPSKRKSTSPKAAKKKTAVKSRPKKAASRTAKTASRSRAASRAGKTKVAKKKVATAKKKSATAKKKPARRTRAARG